MKIRRRKYASGKIGWQLDLGTSKGKRRQLSFKTKVEAEAARDDEVRLRQAHGSRVGDIAPDAMAALLVANERIASAGGSLSEAVEFWIKHAARMKEEVLLADLVEQFTDAKSRAKRSKRYVNQLAVSLGSIVRALPNKKAHEVAKEDLEAWLRGERWEPKTRNNYLGDVSTLFEWGIKAGFARLNPANGVERFRLQRKEIQTLSFEECAAILNAAREDFAVLGYLAIGLFSGVRPAEIGRLTWANVDLIEGHVVIAGEHAKTRERRVVDLSANAVEWLRLIPADLRAGRICGAGFSDAWTFFRRELGWDVGTGGHRWPRSVAPVTRGRWKHNALRHTFASMHYAHHNNEAALQVQMGHESAAMLHKHYRAIKTRAEAARFWGLRPGDVARAIDGRTP